MTPPSTTDASAAATEPTVRSRLADRYRKVRSQSLALCRPLQQEDYRIQSMPDVSPPWWNLGHTSWFFAKNILEPRGLGEPVDRRLEYVLNSYYETHGDRIARADRGSVGRPTNAQVLAFRDSVDRRMTELIATAPEQELETLSFLVSAGIQHEQQHQELLLTEVKHILGVNPRPLRQAYAPPAAADAAPPRSGRFVPIESGVAAIGAEPGGWCWDNELPRHRRYFEPFELFDRLVTNAEYLEFIEDGGYEDPLLWLSNGWSAATAHGWTAPLYWYRVDGAWFHWTLGGDRAVDPREPVCHVSFYEANAFAQWKVHTGAAFAGARLPTEFELERAAAVHGFAAERSNFVESAAFHPRPAVGDERTIDQLAGDLWEWTTSHYEPYPGYRPFEGDLMEYNGKFMDNQRVLRGGSCATPADHIRHSYRNFWPGDTRFQFTGIRLARSTG